MNKLHETLSPRMFDIMHQKAMIFENKKRKWAPDCSNLLLGESLQARPQGTEHRQIPIVSLVEGGVAKSPRKPRQSRVESCTKTQIWSTEELSPLGMSWVQRSACIWLNDPRSEKELSKGLERTVPGTLWKDGDNVCSQQQKQQNFIIQGY